MKFFIIITLLICGSCTETSIQGEGDIRGILINTENNTPIANLSLCVQGISNKCDVTSAEGFFDLNSLPIGNYTLINNNASYDSQKLNISLNKDLDGRKVYYMASDNFTENKMVITISWDKDVDLDSHLVVPIDGVTCTTTGNSTKLTNEDNNTIIDFNNGPAFDISISPFAKLDLDDQGVEATGNMETQRIDLENDGKTKCNGDYYFYVYNFDISGDSFSSLNAKVNVFKNGTKINSFTANDQTSKKTWIVFKISDKETITEINQYADDCSTIISEIPNAAICKKIP